MTGEYLTDSFAEAIQQLSNSYHDPYNVIASEHADKLRSVPSILGQISDEFISSLQTIPSSSHLDKSGYCCYFQGEPIAITPSQYRKYLLTPDIINCIYDKLCEAYIDYANGQFVQFVGSESVASPYEDGGDMDFADCASPNLDTFLNSFKVRKGVET